MGLTGALFLLTGVIHLFRGFYTAFFESHPSLFGPSPVNAILFASSGLVAVGWTFGFILMTGERLLLEAKQSQIPAAPLSPAPDSLRTVPADQVREQVQRIVASDVFRRSARMERFLMVAVERTLTGQPEKLKEYALGRDVFNRGEDYDPRSDSIVRVEAQRLRRKLREYYESQGRSDLVIVEVPPGSYVPLFRYRAGPDDISHLEHSAGL